MKHPDFICVGAQKAGTTAFYDLLNSHDEISMSSKKEIHFFDIDENFMKGLDWYGSFFEENNKLKGECTPDYLLYAYVAERLYKSLGPKIKIIIILRSPAERAYSQFCFHQMKGVENRRDFFKAIDAEEIDLKNEKYTSWYDPAYYLSRGMYSNQIGRYLEFFGREQIHIQLYEELFHESTKETCLNEIAEFLGVSPFILQEAKSSNTTKVPVGGLKGEILFRLKQSKGLIATLKKIIPSSVYTATRQKLLSNMEERPERLSKKQIAEINNRIYREDIEQLNQLTNKNCLIWLDNG